MDFLQRYSLTISLQSSIRKINWPVNAQEPDYVATLVNVLPSCIKNALSNFLNSRKITSGSAFIHQKPLAHFLKVTVTPAPELGDLLVVCRRGKRSSGAVYNALLLQAKRTKNPFQTSIPKNHQYVLYSEWPEFEYRRAGVLDGKRRSILPKTITQGALYLLISETNPIQLFTATVDCPLNGSKFFSETLTDFLSFNSGRTFQATKPRDHWSQMILDLLSLTASSVYSRKNSGYVRAKRLNGEDAFDYIPGLSMQENGMKDEPLFNDNNKADSITGIGVLCVDLGES